MPQLKSPRPAVALDGDYELGSSLTRSPPSSGYSPPISESPPQPSIIQKTKNFRHLSEGARELKPIAGWSEVEWANVLRDSANTTDLFGALKINPNAAYKPEEVARTILKKMAKGLTDEEWRQLVQFQHLKGEKDLPIGQKRDPVVYYPSTDLTVCAIFDREFPMGLEEKDLDDSKTRWKFAVNHSGQFSAQHRDSKMVDFLVWGTLTILAGMMIVFLCIFASRNSLWCLECTDSSNVAPKVAIARTQVNQSDKCSLCYLLFKTKN
jgi:hypothetical protein